MPMRNEIERKINFVRDRKYGRDLPIQSDAAPAANALETARLSASTHRPRYSIQQQIDRIWLAPQQLKHALT